MIWPMCSSSRSITAAGGGSTPSSASQAFTEARWWLTGQKPQMRLVMAGMSQSMRPSQNFSKPRNSTVWKNASVDLRRRRRAG